MKNSKMALVLATSVASISANITNNSVSLPVADICTVKVSVNDTSDNGNMLHKVIKHGEEEDFEIIMQIRGKPAAWAKEMNAAMQQFPYNQFPKMIALKMYAEDKYINLDLEMQEGILTNLKALLSGKDNDDKTPLDLLKENPDLVDMAEDMESFVQEEGAELEANKKAIMEQRMRDQQLSRAMLLMMLSRR